MKHRQASERTRLDSPGRNTSGALAPATRDRDRLRRMIEEALQPAAERAHLVGEMRAALIRGEDVTAMARRLCGLPPMERTP